jgi:hypothetical protein
MHINDLPETVSLKIADDPYSTIGKSQVKLRWREMSRPRAGKPSEVAAQISPAEAVVKLRDLANKIEQYFQERAQQSR